MISAVGADDMLAGELRASDDVDRDFVSGAELVFLIGGRLEGLKGERGVLLQATGSGRFL